MRSLCTISLIVLIGLASYGNVHAQGQNPLSPSGMPWCKALSNIPDPTGGTDGLGDQPNVGGLIVSLTNGTATYNGTTYSVNGTTYSVSVNESVIGSTYKSPSYTATPPLQTFVVAPSDVINAINTARQSENPALPWVTGTVDDASGNAVEIPSPTATTSASTAAGGTTLSLNTPTPAVVSGQAVTDVTNPTAIPPGTTVVSPGTTLTISQAVKSPGVALGDTILFTTLPPNTPTQPLPANYNTLTQDQKLVVLINLERTARGLAPFPTLNADDIDAYISVILDGIFGVPLPTGTYVPYGEIALSWEANNHAAVLAEFYEFNNIDELVHNNSVEGTFSDRILAIPGFTVAQLNGAGQPTGMSLTPQPGFEAETNTQNPENAVYDLLYHDSGSAWGHRHGLLGVYAAMTTTNASTPPATAPTAAAIAAAETLSFGTAPTTGVTGTSLVGDSVTDVTNPAAIPSGTTVVSITGNTVTISQAVTSPGVASGDTIIFDDHCTTQIGAGFAPSPNEGAIQAGLFNQGNPSADDQITVFPPTFFYFVEFVGQETGWQPPIESTLTAPSSLQASASMQGGSVFVSVINPNSGFGLGDGIASVYVYPDPQWGEGYPPNVYPSTTATTTAATPAGADTLYFATAPTVVPGEAVTDSTNSAAIPAGTYVVSSGQGTLTISQPVGSAGVGLGDTIIFPPPPATTAATNAATPAGADTLYFAAAPTVVPDEAVTDTTNSAAIPSGTTVVSSGVVVVTQAQATTSLPSGTYHTLTISQPVGSAGVGSGHTIVFTEPPLGEGALGSGGIRCTNAASITTTASPTSDYTCVATLPSGFAGPVVAIARDAFDQYVCAQPQAQLLNGEICGVPPATVITVTTPAP
jgi:hypothetical protein